MMKLLVVVFVVLLVLVGVDNYLNAQEAAPSRLQFQGSSGVGGVAAVCDTGNGVMVYYVGTSGTGVAVVEHGCNKR